MIFLNKGIVQRLTDFILVDHTRKPPKDIFPTKRFIAIVECKGNLIRNVKNLNKWNVLLREVAEKNPFSPIFMEEIKKRSNVIMFFPFQLTICTSTAVLQSVSFRPPGGRVGKQQHFESMQQQRNRWFGKWPPGAVVGHAPRNKPSHGYVSRFVKLYHQSDSKHKGNHGALTQPGAIHR